MSRALVIGGSSGIGLSLVLHLCADSRYERVYVADKRPFPAKYRQEKVCYAPLDLTEEDFDLTPFADIDTLLITAGYGHLSDFEAFDEGYIRDIFQVNAVAPIRVLRRFYGRINSGDDFYCAVMVSIAGRLSSPLFALYSATKAALCKCIEAVNVELEAGGAINRILEVSPGSLKGTAFNGGESVPEQTAALAGEIVRRMYGRETCFIPQYDEVFRAVLERYHQDAHRFGLESYAYKKAGRKK